MHCRRRYRGIIGTLGAITVAVRAGTGSAADYVRGAALLRAGHKRSWRRGTGRCYDRLAHTPNRELMSNQLIYAHHLLCSSLFRGAPSAGLQVKGTPRRPSFKRFSEKWRIRLN